MPAPAREPDPPLLRVLRPSSGRYFWLSRGKEGSYETAALMANLVREDAVKDEGLERFAKQILINEGLDSHADSKEVASAIFRYVQQLSYIHDPGGSFDAIQSARDTIAKGYGDCDDLSVLLATLLAMVGFVPRFVMARYKNKDGGAPAGFEHIYVDLDLPTGRLVLDPSTRANSAGWEPPNAVERVAYPIFNGKPVSLSGIFLAGFNKFSGRSVVQPNSTTGDIKVAALAASNVTLPVVLCTLGGCALVMKLASKL